MGKHARPSDDGGVCERCGAKARRGNKTFTFVSFAYNEKTRTKGMYLCPKHEEEAVQRGY